jgi:transitional endoplasmic reticulum ATPase
LAIASYIFPLYVAASSTLGGLSFAFMIYIVLGAFVFEGFRSRNLPRYGGGSISAYLFIGLSVLCWVMPILYYRGVESAWVWLFSLLMIAHTLLSELYTLGLPVAPRNLLGDDSDRRLSHRHNTSTPQRDTSMDHVPDNKSVAPSGVSEDRKEFMSRFPAKQASLRFKDVVGMQSFKDRLLAAGQEVVASQPVAPAASKKGVFAKKVAVEQSQAASKARNGILLFGDPGNGKTMMAEALAGELNMPLITVTYGDLASRWVNQTTEVVAAAFDAAAASAPCVLFIDEVDSLLRSRDSMNAYFEHNQTVNTLLTRMVDLRGKGVLLMAATNHVDSLDAAAIREGRFDFKIEVPPPDEAARIAIIERRIQSSHAEYDPDAVNRAAKRWKGFSASRIKTVSDEAVRIAAAEGKRVDFLALTNALRVIQGRTGYRFTEDDPVLDDLVFTPEMKETLYGIADRMIHIEEIEEIGGSVPSGLLFTGEPGGGKTVAAKALAKTAQWAFLSVSGQDLMADAKKVDKTIAMASELRPCVIMIDEAEDVLGDRAFSANATITNKLLAAIDGAGGKTPDVLWVAATNHPDKIDAAARRGGRFTEKVHFAMPDIDAICVFVDKWRSKTKAPLDAAFETKAVAETLAGLSYANLKEVLQTAVNIMVGRRAASAGSGLALSLDDVRRARARVVGA